MAPQEQEGLEQGGQPGPGETSQTGSSSESGSQPSSGSKDVGSEIQTHDDKGVPYFNRYKELEEKYKDVDLEKWTSLKEVDLDYYNELREFAEALEKDESLYNEVMKVIQQKKAPASGGQSGQKPVAPADKPDELSQLKQTVSAMQQRIEREDQEKALGEYDKSFKSEIAKLELTDEEKQMLNDRVESAYIADYQSGKAKLTLKDLPKIVQENYKWIEGYRKKVVNSWAAKNKGDGSPAPIRDGSPQVPGKTSAGAITKNERVNAIADELREKLS